MHFGGRGLNRTSRNVAKLTRRRQNLDPASIFSNPRLLVQSDDLLSGGQFDFGDIVLFGVQRAADAHFGRFLHDSRVVYGIDLADKAIHNPTEGVGGRNNGQPTFLLLNDPNLFALPEPIRRIKLQGRAAMHQHFRITDDRGVALGFGLGVGDGEAGPSEQASQDTD